MRKVQLLEGEHYHIFNRGVDKRAIFEDDDDFDRFLLSLVEFNSVEPIGSIYEHSFHKESKLGNLVSKLKRKRKRRELLVELIVYCLNKNHFHLIVRQCAEKGVEKFMHRLGLGYTKYFNEKYDRSGSLFQGTFKAKHIETNEQLLYVSCYVNLNNLIHGYIKNFRSSWHEYIDNLQGICKKDIILGQYKSIKEYRKMVEETVEEIRNKREQDELLME